jgi:putative transposase
MDLIQEAVDNGAREFKACREIGISLRTLQRWRSERTPNEDQRPLAVRPEPKNKLSDEEKEEIINIINQPQYMSLPPSQIVPDLADKGIYIASETSFYRVMHEYNLQKHRGKSKAPQKRPISTHYATGPNQVWMWDITYLPGPIRGTYYYLYLILDLFSRKIVGWDIWLEQTATNASQLVRRAVINEKIRKSKEPLVLHSDNGSPMKGATLLATLYELGITPSRSRPRVSNDNPYAESIFKTCKYRPDFPDNGFEDIDEARRWVFEFVQWYNYKHKHSGIKYLTPYQRHNNQGDEILNNRKKVYEQAKLKHPERWSRETRNWDLNDVVWLNPEKEELLPEEIKKQSS